MTLPVNASEPRMEKYILRLLGSLELERWEWRFSANDLQDAIARSVHQLSIVGGCRQVSGAMLIHLVPSGAVMEPSIVYRFTVKQSVIVQEDM